MAERLEFREFVDFQRFEKISSMATRSIFSLKPSKKTKIRMNQSEQNF